MPNTIEIPYAHLSVLTRKAKQMLSLVAHELYPGDLLKLVDDPESILLSPEAIEHYPAAQEILRSQMMRLFGLLPRVPDDFLFLDIETHNAEKRWDMPLSEFFRLGQYAWGEGEVVLTTNLDHLLAQIAKARRVIAHNGHSFDFSVLLGDDALHAAYEGRLFDTWVHATVHFPMPVTYLHTNGRTYTDYNTSPANARRWFGLDNQAFQFGFEGKSGDLKELAKKYNPPKTPTGELDFGLIPVDDPDFLEYAKQDIVALREYFRSMLAVAPINDYDRRAQFRSAIDGQMTRNGVMLDVALAQSRVAEAEEQKEATLAKLEAEYDFPTEGKMPWRTKPGKEAIMRILADNGITPKTVNWPLTATGNPSLGGDALIALTKGTPVEALGSSLALLQGQRPLAEQALRYLSSDGRVHPSIDALQRSGRTSISEPGLTTWGSRTEAGIREKEYFIASPGHKMIEFDLSNADQRAVAFMSGDKEYAKRFLPGVDGHEITGRIVFGDATYDSDPKKYRNIAKAIGHAYSYGASPKKLASTSGQPLEITTQFTEAMARAYPRMIAWQNRVRRDGENGWVTNLWGRRMPVQSGRSYTQSPALLGQSSTTELLYDGLIRLYELNPEFMSYVLFPVHDALVCSPPEELVEEFTEALLTTAQQTINNIDIFMEAGHPASDWSGGMHG